VGPTVNVTVAAGQRIHVTSHKYMGSSTGASGLDLFVCTQQGADPIASAGSGMFNGSVPAGTRIAWGISGVLTPVAGTYTVGMCARSPTPANWNSNEFGYTSALVFQQ
jgi:hypothetical protein